MRLTVALATAEFPEVAEVLPNHFSHISTASTAFQLSQESSDDVAWCGRLRVVDLTCMFGPDL